MNVTEFTKTKSPVYKYKFDDIYGEEFDGQDYSGNMVAKLYFAGLIFEVVYDMNGDWSEYGIQCGGYVPSVTELFDNYHTSLNEAVAQAQDEHYQWLVENRLEDDMRDHEYSSEAWG